MPSRPELYPALHVIFTLLNAIRRGIARRNLWREFRRQKVTLQPRLAFWIALCKQAGLLEEYQSQLRVKRHARQWLNKLPDEQTFLLIEAWQNAPKNPKARQFRRKLLWKLRHEKSLTRKDQRAMNGLQALGLWEGGKLTTWGCFFLKREGKLPTPASPMPCQMHEDHFIASIPHHIDLLWELEKQIRPASPGRYPLSKRALHFLHGDPHELIALLERGLRDSLPAEIKARLLDQPSVRMIEGVVLEFSHPADLQKLRRQPNFRRHFEQVISPRHVLLDAKESKGVSQILERRGVYLTSNEELPETRKKRTHFPQKGPLQTVGPAVPKIQLLETYLQLQQAVDVLYRAPGFSAERRRITPLLIEQRGEHTYVIAFCQTHRAQRTFRLDRMEIPGTY